MAAKALRGLGGALVALFVVSGDMSMADVGAPETEAQAPASEVRNRIWVRQFGTRFFDSANAVATDSAGNILIGGQTDGSLAEPRQGLGAAFVVKYSATGDRIWVRQLGTSVGAAANAVATNAEGNILIAGDTFGSLAGPYHGGYDGFVAKYDAAGTLIWVRQFGTTQNDLTTGVATDALGNVLVTGGTRGALDGSNAGEADVFVAKYNAAGDLLWVRQFGTAESDWARGGVAMDSYGHILIGGETWGSLGGPAQGGSDAFVAKMDAAGELLWTRQLGSNGTDEGWGVATDEDGDVVICGQTWGDLVSPNRTIDAFVAKYDANGSLRWVRHLSSSGAQFDEAYGVAIDPDGNVVISGGTTGSLGGLNPAPGQYDAFLAKFDPAGTILWKRHLGTSEVEWSWEVMPRPTSPSLAIHADASEAPTAEIGTPSSPSIAPEQWRWRPMPVAPPLSTDAVVEAVAHVLEQAAAFPMLGRGT